MTHKTKLTVLALAASALLFTACKEHMNDEKYQSMPPTISGVTFHVAGTGSTDLRVGDGKTSLPRRLFLGNAECRGAHAYLFLHG